MYKDRKPSINFISSAEFYRTCITSPYSSVIHTHLVRLCVRDQENKTIKAHGMLVEAERLGLAGGLYKIIAPFIIFVKRPMRLCVP